ncbi:TPA: DUF5617 domain-containing protein [Legionella feeleii]
MFLIELLKNIFLKKEKFYVQAPNRVKEQEKNRLNPCFSHIRDVDGLIPGVSYLWVIDQEGNINIGIEKPWLYPQAFGLKNESDEWTKIKKTLYKSGGFGHPTLSPVFDKKGNVATSTDTKCCYFGGEINYKDGKWVVDNNSGRFGIINLDENKLQNALNIVSSSIRNLTKYRVDVNLMTIGSTYLKSYYIQWTKGKSNLESSIKLLEDYANGNSVGSYLKLRFFRDGSKDLTLVKEIIQKAKECKIETVEELIASFTEKEDIHHFDGGLQRRLKFISGQCGLELSKHSDPLSFLNN